MYKVLIYSYFITRNADIDTDYDMSFDDLKMLIIALAKIVLN